MAALPSFLLASLFFAVPCHAQRAKAKADLDPFTRGKKSAMVKAGYVSFGPFPKWGDDHSSKLIAKLITDEKLLWVETEHFCIGCSLTEYDLPKSSKVRRQMRQELKALSAKLPRVRAKTRKLTPWLRLHLYADRCERLYSQFRTVMGVTDADFPKDPTKVKADASPYMGKGPYLGMPGKFRVLLLNKTSNVVRYATRTGLQNGNTGSIAMVLPERQAMLLAMPFDVFTGDYANDRHIHAMLVFRLSHALLNCYKYYAHNLPPWLCDGLANYFVRKLDPEKHNFTALKDGDASQLRDPKWEVKLRKRLKHRHFTPGKKLSHYTKFEEMTFADQMAAWSRVDFMIRSHGGKAFAKFMHAVKDKLPHAEGQLPTMKTVFETQDKALQDAFGMGWSEFDEAWQVYVMKNYPKK